MTDWIYLNPREFDALQSGKRSGGLLTKFDVPIAVRANIDSERDVYRIEFRYLGNPEREKQVAVTDADLFLGQESGRLHAVQIANSERLSKVLRNALNELIARYKFNAHNYRAAEYIFEENLPALTAADPVQVAR